MKTTVKLTFIVIFCTVFISACGQRNSSSEMRDESYPLSEMSMDEAAPAEYKEQASSEVSLQGRTVSAPASAVSNFIASEAAAINLNDGIYRFIRTAKMKFKVDNTVEATYAIESIIVKNRGFIIKSAIRNERSYSHSVDVSKDSTLTITDNYLTSNLELRVPQEMLYETLKEIAPIASVIDYRTVEAQDVSIDILSNKLLDARMSRKNKRLAQAIDTKGQKLNDIVGAEEALDRVEAQANQAELATYSLNDKINYSTISIYIYQDATESRDMLPRRVQVEEYVPGFESKVVEGLSFGWFILSSIILFFINIWPIVLIAIVISVILIKYSKRRNKKS